MSTWSWKQLVAEQVLEIVNLARSSVFTLQDIYAQEAVFRQRFPRNRNVREKIRQTLQRLRDDGFIGFLGGAEYSLNLKYADLDLEPARVGETGVELPETRTVVRQVRLRNTLLAAEIKRRYDNTCQVCRKTVCLAHGGYAESHHIKPLGTPHNGPDIHGNILVACPNHHVMFDRGALKIEAKSLLVTHIAGAMTPRPLMIQSWHVLNPQYLEYHRLNIYGKV